MKTLKLNYKNVIITTTITNHTTFFDINGYTVLTCKNKDSKECYKSVKLHIDNLLIKNPKELGLIKFGNDYISF